MDDFPSIFKLPEVFFEASERPKCPSPTLLYGLQPYGVGTGACESLKSYISRLADAHRVSVFALVTDVLGKKLLSDKRKWYPDITVLSNFLPIGWYTSKIITVLTEATSVDGLVSCTMIPFQDILGGNHLFTMEDRHCPLCLDEARERDGLYCHLVWNIACVKACPIHGVHLEISNCGAPSDARLKMSFRKMLSGVCPFCGSIGYQCRLEKPVFASDVDVWKARQIADVISCLPESDKIFSSQNLFVGLKSLVESFSDGKSAIAARRAGINKSVLWGWLKRKYAPTLGLLLDLCLAAEVSLLSVMKGKPVACTSPYLQAKPSKRRSQKPPTEERETALKNALVAVPPQSLSAVAHQLKLDESTLRGKFPELSACVVNRYRQFRLDQKNEHFETVKEFGLNLIKELKAKGVPLTARNIRAETGHSFGPWTILYRVINTALAEQQNRPDKLSS